MYAKLGLVWLGDAAKPAVPELKQLLDDPRYSEDAGSVLARLGHEGIGALTNGLVSRHWEVREATAFNLCLDGDDSKYATKEARILYRRDAAVAVPMLIGMLRDPNTNVAAAAAFALGSLNQRPEIAVPALSAVSVDTNIDVGVRKVAAKQMAKLKLGGTEPTKK
jgi:HEAT repeat protein